MQLRRRLVPTRSKWPTPVIAAVTSVALVAAAAFGGNQVLKTQSQGSGPIDATTASSGFGDGETIVVDDPAIATQGGGEASRAVKQFHRDEQFSMFAITWPGQRDINAFVRAKQEDGSWSQWYEMDTLKNEAEGTSGTELIWVGPTNDVQVNVGNVDLFEGTNLDSAEAESGDAPTEVPVEEGDENAAADNSSAAEYSADIDTPDASQEEASNDEGTNEDSEANDGAVAPLNTNYGDIAPVAETENTGGTGVDDLEAVFIDGNAQEGEVIEPTAFSPNAPRIVSRAGWGANEGLRCQNPTYDRGVKALTLHHTAGNNNYTPAQARAQLRGDYTYHARTLGWCDIGYNAIVDQYGTIYEGRYGGLDKAVQGAHVGGFNSNTWGISMLGNFEVAQPPQEMLNSVAEIAGWKAAISGFDPSGRASLRSGGFSGARYGAGVVANVPAFHGHADLHYTACPGRNVISKWPQIRQATKAKYDAVRSGSNSGGINWGDQNSQPSQPSQPSRPQQPNQPQPATANSSVGNVDIPMPVIQALTVIAGVVFTVLVRNDRIETPDADEEVIGGLTVGEIPNIVSRIVTLTGNPNLEKSWTTALNAFGPALGLSVGGPEVDDESGIISQIFENGVMLSSEETGTHALIGEIAKAWASGENAAELGLPTSGEELTGNGQEVKVQFQGGEIAYDPESETVNVFTD